MVNYKEGKIYMIKSPDHEKVYIGSTTYKLRERLQSHFKDLRRNKYCTAQELLKNDNYEMLLIEKYPCENSTQLKQRERFFIENFNTINKVIPLQTQKEYYMKNREKLLKYKKEWRLKKNNLLQEKIQK
jgi:hypothetical protein